MKTSCAFLTMSLVVSIASASAQQTDEERLAAIARNAAEQFAAAQAAQAQAPSPVPAPIASDLTVNLSLEEALERALENNLELVVERLNPRLQDLNLVGIRASYLPTLQTTYSQNNSTRLPTTQLNGGFVTTNNSTQYNTGVSQSVPFYGGNYSATWNNSRQETNDTFSNFNPSYNTSLRLNYTQPLLRNFLIDGTRRSLKSGEISREVADITLQARINTLVANVRTAYWNLLYAVQAIEVARTSLEIAEQFVRDNQARVEVGTLAPLDVRQAEAEVATRRQALVQAEGTRLTNEIALKRLIVTGTSDPIWQATVTPVDTPEFVPEAIDVEAAVRRALDVRTDVAQARKTIENNDLSVKYLKNQTLPSLDFSANYQTQGVGGTRFVRSGLGGAATEVIPGGYRDALSTLGSFDFPVWGFQLNLSYPIGGSAQNAQYARAQVQRNQVAAQLEALELQVATDITSAALSVQTSLTAYESAVVARELREEQLDAEQSRFEVGLSTSYIVVQAQRDLSTAQDSELRALLNYRQALVEFERVQVTSSGGAGITAIN